MENYSHLQRQTGWSDTIFRAIGSEEETLIYMKAETHQAKQRYSPYPGNGGDCNYSYPH